MPFSVVVVHYGLKSELADESPFVLVFATLASVLARSFVAFTTLFFILSERSIIRKIKQTASRAISRTASREPSREMSVVGVAV